MILKSLWGSLDAQKQLRTYPVPWSLQQSLCCWKQIESLKVHGFSLVFLLSLASGFQSGETSQDNFHPSLQGYLLLTTTTPCVAISIHSSVLPKGWGWSLGSSAGYQIHHHLGVGAGDGGERLRQVYFCLELNSGVLQKRNISAEFGQI